MVDVPEDGVRGLRRSVEELRYLITDPRPWAKLEAAVIVGAHFGEEVTGSARARSKPRAHSRSRSYVDSMYSSFELLAESIWVAVRRCTSGDEQ